MFQYTNTGLYTENVLEILSVILIWWHQYINLNM